MSRLVRTAGQLLFLKRHRWTWQCRKMDEKLVKVNILKENRATVEMPFCISSTVPSAGSGHLEYNESCKNYDVITMSKVKYNREDGWSEIKQALLESFHIFVCQQRLLYSVVMRSQRTG